ncbi:MAG: trigger factor [candidate division WOR-3 bacterium]
MEYQIVNETETEKEIEFKLGTQELEPFIDNSIEKLKDRISIKGYRKGRAPKSLIRTRYYDTLKAEAINDLILDLYKKVLQEKNWKPVSNPELVSFNDTGEIKFNLRFEVQPEFDVNDYKGLELFREEPLPLDYLYEQTLNRLKENYADVVETSKPAAVDDFITLDLEIIENNNVVDKQSDLVIKLGDRSFPDELNRALVGVKKGEKKDVQINKQIYRLKIKKVEEKILAKVDEEFAKMLNYNSLEEMEKGLKDMLQKQEEERLNDELKENLAQILLERFHFPVPKSLIEREYQVMLRSSNLNDNESNRERFIPIAEKRARYNMILDKIAQKENIQVSEEELINLIQKNGFNIDEVNEELKEYFRRALMRDMVVQFLLKNSNIVQKGRILSPEEAKNANRSIRH